MVSRNVIEIEVSTMMRKHRFFKEAEIKSEPYHPSECPSIQQTTTVNVVVNEKEDDCLTKCFTSCFSLGKKAATA